VTRSTVGAAVTKADVDRSGSKAARALRPWELLVTGRQGKGTRSDQCILVKTIVVARGKEKKNECGKETIYSRGRLAKGWSARRQVPKV
jgi:hypothetical protein